MAAWQSQRLFLCSSRNTNTSKHLLCLPGSQCCYRTCIYLSQCGLGTAGTWTPLCCPFRPCCRGRGSRGVPAVALCLYPRGFVTSSRNKGPSFLFPSPFLFSPRGPAGAGRGRWGAARARRVPRAPSGGAMAAAAMAAALSRCGSGGARRGEGGGSGFALLRLLGGAARHAGGVRRGRGLRGRWRPGALQGLPEASPLRRGSSAALQPGRGAGGRCPGLGGRSEPLTGWR